MVKKNSSFFSCRIARGSNCFPQLKPTGLLFENARMVFLQKVVRASFLQEVLARVSMRPGWDKLKNDTCWIKDFKTTATVRRKLARSTLTSRMVSGLHLRSIHLKVFLLVLSSLPSAIALAAAVTRFLSSHEKLQRIWMVRCHWKMSEFCHAPLLKPNLWWYQSQARPAAAWNDWRPEGFRPQFKIVASWFQSRGMFVSLFENWVPSV